MTTFCQTGEIEYPNCILGSNRDRDLSAIKLDLVSQHDGCGELCSCHTLDSCGRLVSWCLNSWLWYLAIYKFDTSIVPIKSDFATLHFCHLIETKLFSYKPNKVSFIASTIFCQNGESGHHILDNSMDKDSFLRTTYRLQNYDESDELGSIHSLNNCGQLQYCFLN